MILIAVVPMLLVLLVIRSARVRSQEKQQLLNEQAQGILGSGFGGTRKASYPSTEMGTQESREGGLAGC